MGSRGASSGIGAVAGSKPLNEVAQNYQPYAYGQISRYEAGVIYRATKDGNITARPETTQELYDATKSYIRFATERYNQDFLYYERIYDATRAILNEDFAKAQKIIDEWEYDRIYRATKKSKWYKYQTEKDRERWRKYNGEGD